MSILSLCNEIPASVPLAASVADAIKTMLAEEVGAVVVVDDNKVVAGIFTERDVLRKLALTGKDPSKLAVRDVMTTPVIMATQDTPAGEALEVMVREHHRHLPVVDDHAKLLGLLSIRNLLEAKVDALTAQFEDAQKA
jgi:CBS domain-containing protein